MITLKKMKPQKVFALVSDVSCLLSSGINKPIESESKPFTCVLCILNVYLCICLLKWRL